MKVNVLIDGGFLEQALKKQQKQISIAEVDTIVKQAVTSLQTKFGTVVSVNLFRVLYYDCFPFAKKAFLGDIAKQDRFGLRAGQLSFRGWTQHKNGKYSPIFQQKGVDMKCGLDIAVMSMKKIVDAIIIIAGDSDFIAPLKVARKEGVLVAIQSLGLPTKEELIKHSDFYL